MTKTNVATAGRETPPGCLKFLFGENTVDQGGENIQPPRAFFNRDLASLSNIYVFTKAEIM